MTTSRAPARATPPRAATRPPPEPKPPRRTIVHLTAEYYPYARTGGLAEAVAGLANFQSRAGDPVVIVMPLYALVRAEAPDLEPLAPAQHLTLGPRTEEIRIFREPKPRQGPQIIFVDAPR